MRKIIIWILSFIKFRPTATNPVIQDLLDNDHHYCNACGDLFYSVNPKKLYCSPTCKNHFNNSKKVKK